MSRVSPWARVRRVAFAARKSTWNRPPGARSLGPWPRRGGVATILDGGLEMTQEARSELRADLLARLPHRYSPWLHLALPAIAGVSIAALALSRIEGLRAWQLALVPLFLVAANAIEWHAHRGLLHRRTRPLETLYVRHTPQHHAVYVADDMSIRDFRELKLILLPAWGVLAIVAASSPVAVALVLARRAERRGAVDRDDGRVRALVRVAPPRLPPARRTAAIGGLRVIAVAAPASPAPPRAAPHAAVELQRHAAAVGSRPRHGLARPGRRSAGRVAAARVNARDAQVHRAIDRDANRRRSTL